MQCSKARPGAGTPSVAHCNTLATYGYGLDDYSINVTRSTFLSRGWLRPNERGLFHSVLVDGARAAGEPDLVCRLLFALCACQRAAGRDVPAYAHGSPGHRAGDGAVRKSGESGAQRVSSHTQDLSPLCAGWRWYPRQSLSFGDMLAAPVGCSLNILTP
jgi:hypothetical protein